MTGSTPFLYLYQSSALLEQLHTSVCQCSPTSVTFHPTVHLCGLVWMKARPLPRSSASSQALGSGTGLQECLQATGNSFRVYTIVCSHTPAHFPLCTDAQFVVLLKRGLHSPHLTDDINSQCDLRSLVEEPRSRGDLSISLSIVFPQSMLG